MFIRTTMMLFTAFLMLVAVPTLGEAQDAAAVLQEVQKALGKDVPRSVRVTTAGSGYKSAGAEARQHYRIESSTRELDLAAPDAYWTNPYAFLAGATSQPATLTKETLLGTTYRVVTFTTPAGQQVRGYITDQNVLERARTELQDGGRKVLVETVFFDWADFKGLRFPSILIHRENDQVARILVVSHVEPAGTARATSD